MGVHARTNECYAGQVKVLLALVFSIALASPALAASPSCDECRDLPKLQQELFEQEWLQHEFRQYALGNKSIPSGGDPKNTAQTLADKVTADFRAWLKTPAGGGKRDGNPELGTDWSDCSLVAYVTKKKKVPFDEKAFRRKNCSQLADYLIAHEMKHVEQCKKYGGSNRVDLSYYMDYAAFDAEAYGTGIRNLRKSIADLAKKCGWEGSTRPTKKNPDDRLPEEQDVVPTKKEVEELAKRVVKK